MPSIVLCAPGFVGGAIELARQRLVQDVVDERGLARSAHAGHGVSTPSGIVTSMSLRLFARAPLIDDLAAVAVRRVRGVSIAARRADTRRSATRCRPASSSAGVPWKITCPPCSPGARPEVDDVVRGPDRFFVVLDDDDGVAEIAQPRQRASSLRLSRWCRPIDGSSST